MGAPLLGSEVTTYPSSSIDLQILKEADRHRYKWKNTSRDTVIELTVTRDGHTEYDHTINRESDDDSQRRVGTTGLPPEAADHVWRWYNDVYETAYVNNNRSRGVRAFFERAVLFPQRMAIEGTCRQTSIESTLQTDWAHWVVSRGIMLTDIDRTALLIEEEGSTNLPLPQQQDDQTDQGQKPKTDRILSHNALIAIIAFSILYLISVDLLPTLSHTWFSFVAIGGVLMISAFLAHIKR